MEDGYIYLPYTYGRKLLSAHIIPNQQITCTSFSIINPPREYQIPLIAEAWQQLQTHGTTTLAIFTGAGKTYMASYLAAVCQGLTLLMCPASSDAFLKVWCKTLTTHTTAKIWVVGQESMPAQVQFIICLDTRIDKIPPQLLKMVKTLIIDEVHSFGTQRRLNILLGIEPKYIIAASATNFREDGTYAAIEAMVGLHSIYKKSTKLFTVVKYQTGIFIPKFDTDSNWADHNTFIAQNEERNKLIVDTALLNVNAGKKVLILCWKKDHVTKLVQSLTPFTTVAQMTGGIKSYSDSNILVGTISKIGTGFDEETVCEDFGGVRLDVLLLVGSMRSVGLLEQVAGRVFRSQFPTIIHFVDDNKISTNHWNAGYPWYISRNGQVIEGQSNIYMKKALSGQYKSKGQHPIATKEAYLSLLRSQLQNI